MNVATLVATANFTHAMSPSSCKILSLIPPMTQLNTPYPSTAYLTGFLRSRGFDAHQEDLALELVLQLLSAEGFDAIHDCVLAIANDERSPQAQHFVEHFARYRTTIASTIAFLQGRDSTLAHRIASRRYLPEGARFATLDAYANDAGDALSWAFGSLGTQDRARHLATLYLNDLADVLREAVDPRFEFVRYAEALAQSQPTFEPLHDALHAEPTLVDDVLQQLTVAALEQHQPAVVLISVPFPGSVYGAFRMAQTIKQHDANVVIVLGGGYVNTELRSLKELRVFDYFDYVTLDDGELPVLAIVEYLQGKRTREQLVRTFVRSRHCDRLSAPHVDKLSDRIPVTEPVAVSEVIFINHTEPDISFNDIGIPTWEGLPIDRYLSLLDMLNPMHRLWSDGRWNKLTVAHGCYWKQCSFCDVTLDYISRYEAASAAVLCDRIEAIVNETGQTGFHFVDEAAPPKSLKALALEIQRRELSISWWGNIRFEKSFNPELCQLLADSGCIAISGGLEVASDRLLRLMKKGVSVAQVARVTKAFSDAGILVHAYLMYGFPTQTVQDTVDALEYVRQLFAAGCIQSGFWHRFTCTVHSPVGQHPEEYGVILMPPKNITFASNDINFIDPTGVDHDALGTGLNKAIYNFMHGVGLEQDVRDWFDLRVPKTTVTPDFVAQALDA
jgi:radical SAM superfamily enzyme YgiQ (UPF0313 family)